jgi:type IV pilus assembly protein PilV
VTRNRHPAPARAQRGIALLEALVAIIIMVVGLFGVAGLHSRMGLAESEAFQRSQAVMLMGDMVSRITANRKNSLSYVTATPLGTGQAQGSCAALTGAPRDLCEWNNALLGASESLTGSKVGAMLGARGCVESISATMPRQFRVSVVWQGTVPTVAPGATACGAGSYADDRTRRAITTVIEIGCLQNDPASLLCISTF